MNEQEDFKAYTATGKARADWWYLAAALCILIKQVFSPLRIEVDEEPLKNGIEYEFIQLQTKATS